MGRLVRRVRCLLLTGLTLDEAGQYPHNSARSLIAEVDGVEQPRPTPRFFRTPGGIGRAAPDRGAHTQEVLEEWGIATS